MAQRSIDAVKDIIDYHAKGMGVLDDNHDITIKPEGRVFIGSEEIGIITSFQMDAVLSTNLRRADQFLKFDVWITKERP